MGEGREPRGLGLCLDPPPLITTDEGVTKWRIVQGLDGSLLDIVISHAMKWWSDEVEDCPDEMSTTLMLAGDGPGEMR